MSTRKEDDEEEDKNSTPTWVWVIVGIVLSLVIMLAAMYYLGQINKVSQEQQQQQQPLTARQQRRKQNMDLLNYINENKDNFNRETNILAKRALKTSIDMTRKQNKIDALYGY